MNVSDILIPTPVPSTSQKSAPLAPPVNKQPDPSPEDDIDDLDLDLDGMNIDDNIDTSVSINNYYF